MAHSKKVQSPQLWPGSAAPPDLDVFCDELEALFTALADDQSSSDTATVRRSIDDSSGALAGHAGTPSTKSASGPAESGGPQWDQRADPQGAPPQSAPPELPLDPPVRPPRVPASDPPTRLEPDGDPSARAALQGVELSFSEEDDESIAARAAVSVSSIALERNIDSPPRATRDVQPSGEKEDRRRVPTAACLLPVSREPEASYSRPAAARSLGGNLSASNSTAPKLDSLVNELESALPAQQMDGALQPGASKTPPSSDDSPRANVYKRTRIREEARGPADPASVQRRWSEPKRSAPMAVSDGVQPSLGDQDHNKVRLPQWQAASVPPKLLDPVDEEEQLEELLPVPLALRTELFGARSHSTNSTGGFDAIDRGEELATRPIPREPGQRGVRLITHVAIPAVALIMLLGVGAVWLLPMVALGSLPTGIPQNVTTIVSTGGAGYSDEAEKRRAEPGDRNELEPPTQPAQVPTSRRLVRTIPIPARAAQPAFPLLGAELSPVGPTEEAGGMLPPTTSTQSSPAFDAPAPDSMTRAQSKLEGILDSTGQQSIQPRITTEPGGARWSGAAAGNASLAERFRAGQGEEDQPDVPELRAEPAVGSSDEGASVLGEPDPEANSSGDLTAQATRFAHVTTHVNMRGGPDSDAAIVMVVPAGAEVGVVRCDIWCEVVFEGARGWIYKSFVAGADA
jgi:hypothetical protein